MNCTEIRPLLSAYYDGEATPEERATVDRHLVRCADCRQALAEYRAIGSDIRALPVPIPPTGLRRDVWRAIEAQGATHNTAGALPRAKVAPVPQRRQANNKPVPILTRIGNGWGKVLPAAAVLAAVLLIFVVTMILKPGSFVQAAASLQEQSPITDYGQALHVQFAKAVSGDDAEKYTNVSRIEGGNAYPVADVSKSYDSATYLLTIRPESTWEPGANYEVHVDAPNIRLGIGTQTLDKKPLTLAFSAVAHTPTPTATYTKTAIPTQTPKPTSTPQSTTIAKSTAVVPAGRPPSATAITKASPTTVPADTNTPVPDSPTPTLAPSNTALPTHTLEPSATATPTAHSSFTATVVPTHKGTQTPAPRITTTPRVTPSATPPCGVMPVNGFGKVWRENSGVRSRLGCPTASEIGIQTAADQHFQGGYMFWREDTHTIYVFLGGETGNWYAFADTWQDGEPTPLPVGTPPTGMYAPVRGFGKLWSAYPGLRQSLGWAVDQESSITAAWQPFQSGNALWTSDRTIRILYDDGTFASFEDSYVQPTPTPRGR